jgi:hypothetical protein
LEGHLPSSTGIKAGLPSHFQANRLSSEPPVYMCLVLAGVVPVVGAGIELGVVPNDGQAGLVRGR